MSISGFRLKVLVLAFILRSFDPFEIGLRRNDILNQVIRDNLNFHKFNLLPRAFLYFHRFTLIPRVSTDPLTSDEKNALNSRLQTVLNNLVQSGLIKRKSKEIAYRFQNPVI